jgi:DNA-binding response OmpR family regulator
VSLDERLPDCIVLHMGASRREALLLVERVRSASNAPVIIISDRAASDDQVAELVEAGADDFIAAPFGQKEFIARVSRAVRRWRNGGGVQQRIELGSVVLDTMKLTVCRDGNCARLSPIQFKVLLALVEQPGAVLPRSALIAAGWGSPYHASDDALRVTIKRLRERLAQIADGFGPTIVAVPGFGYYLDTSESAVEA